MMTTPKPHRPPITKLLRWAPAAALTMVASTLAVLPPTSAHAYIPGVPPCYGHTCVGKSPYVQNHEGHTCVSGDGESNNGTKTIDSAHSNVDGGTVYLRWSAFCAANWATTSKDPGYADAWAQTADGHTEYSGASTYTTMVDGTQLARACQSVYSSGPICTGWN